MQVRPVEILINIDELHLSSVEIHVRILLKNKIVLNKINFYFDNTILYFNNSQLACREIQINFVEHHVSL